MNKKQKKQNTNYIIAVSAGIFFLAADLGTKALALLAPGASMSFLGNFFYIAPYQMNDGIAFGIDIPWWIQIFGSLIFITILIHMAEEHIFNFKKPLFFPSLLFGFLIGGASGNLISRLIQGYVVDFIALKPFPLFNIADVGITVGLFGLFILSFLSKNFKQSLQKPCS